MEDLLKSIGHRICTQRKLMGYTQEQLSEMMDVSIQMISNLERGNKSIKIENLLKVCSILNVSTDYILKGEYSETDKNTLFEKIKNLSDRDYQIVNHLVDCFFDE